MCKKKDKYFVVNGEQDKSSLGHFVPRDRMVLWAEAGVTQMLIAPNRCIPLFGIANLCATFAPSVEFVAAVYGYLRLSSHGSDPGNYEHQGRYLEMTT
ncbi:hypothetical protein DdX_17818 [Ditylenchus destructor]|uniref:Uncharacterized protein n=1 Tax=Ditylenchus destructor TaxID=166010 RepID=A0AAD4ML17_9BILA|nr:hypothetical protein DdX_17818 [Ditylenchus destructor]